MNNDQMEIIDKLHRELRLNRILTIISIVVTLVLFAVIIRLQWTVRTTMEPLEEQLSQIDMETVNGIMEDLEVVTGELAGADIDWEEFSETLANLNEVIDTLQQLGEMMGSSVQGWLFGGD